MIDARPSVARPLDEIGSRAKTLGSSIRIIVAASWALCAVAYRFNPTPRIVATSSRGERLGFRRFQPLAQIGTERGLSER